MRNAEFPAIAELGGTLYVAWNDGATGHSHIRLASSRDGGHTWALRWVTEGASTELQPAISADSALHILYYQANANRTLDTIVADSSDGTSFTTERVTTQSFPGVFTAPQFDPILAPAYMGDYIGNVSDGRHQYFVWGDNRDKVTNFLWPGGRQDPNVYPRQALIAGGMPWPRRRPSREGLTKHSGPGRTRRPGPGSLPPGWKWRP